MGQSTRSIESKDHMRQIVAHAAKDLRLEDAEVPRMEYGQVGIELAVGGICGSDLHTYLGHRKEKTPAVLGHEAVGKARLGDRGDDVLLNYRERVSSVAD